MLEARLASQAIQLLSTAIAELIEDAHELAATVSGPGAAPSLQRAATLRQLGEDAAVLASSIEVLARRSGEAGSRG